MDKKLRDLNDVNKVLEEKPAEEVTGLRKGRRQTAMHNDVFDIDELKGMLVIPAIVLVLMVIIVILDRDPSSEVKEANVPKTRTETVAAPETTVEETEDPTIVREYHDEYLTAFFEKFFEARLNADVDTLYEMTGVSNQTPEQSELLKSQLQTQAGYIESYSNIRQYAVNALEENSRLVFVTYDVKFRRVDTLAPGIMYCYVKVNDSNQFEIIENLSPDQTKFVNEYITSHEEVQELINTSNSNLLQAISGDERLAVIYDAFQSGRIYTDSQEAIDSQVSLIAIDGNEVATEPATEAAEETEAENEAGTETGAVIENTSETESQSQ